MNKFDSLININIKDIATKATSFPEMCYPHSLIEDHCRIKYIEGAKMYKNIILETLKNYFDSATPCTNDNNLSIKNEDKSLWDFYNTLLIDIQN